MSYEEPVDVAEALQAAPAAAARFAALPPSHRREYLNWIAEAKKPQTRARRVAQMVERLAGEAAAG
jgi:uncharacterized protein YdeI (YjbR/CyaY-like superfamily)